MKKKGEEEWEEEKEWEGERILLVWSIQDGIQKPRITCEQPRITWGMETGGQSHFGTADMGYVEIKRRGNF